MATLVFAPIEQSTLETSRIWQFDFAPDMPAGVTIASASAIHVPPSGAALTPTIVSIVGSIVTVRLGQLLPTSFPALHYLDCLATYSNPDAERSHIRLAIPCNY